jgi:hypothetical protein
LARKFFRVVLLIVGAILIAAALGAKGRLSLVSCRERPARPKLCAASGVITKWPPELEVLCSSKLNFQFLEMNFQNERTVRSKTMILTTGEIISRIESEGYCVVPGFVSRETR